MRKIIILTDSTSDLSRELRERYNIEYLQMQVSYAGKDLPASLDWDLYTPGEFYDIMRQGTRIYTTQIMLKGFTDAFTEYIEDGCDVLYIGCSSALSGSVTTSYKVRDELKFKYPEAKIYCFDTLASTMGEGLMAIRAANLRDEGKSIDEIYEILVKERLTYNQIATVDNLEYLHRAGRVTASSSFFGNLFGVKPLIISDVKGQNVAVRKVKGRNTSLTEIVAYVKDNIIVPENQTICVGHADCEGEAERVAVDIRRDVKCKDVYTYCIGPIVGASVGPGTIIVFFVGKEVTYEG